MTRNRENAFLIARRIAWGAIALGTIVSLWNSSISLPLWSMLALAFSFWPLAIAWRETSGLALRPGVIWAFLAVLLGIAGQVFACREAMESGRPIAGHFAYLSSLGTLAALISVFGARKPGSGAWALLMGLLVVVFLLPWVEGSGLMGRASAMDRLRLEAPWSIFFAGLAVAGVSNYVPTRWGRSALVVGASLVVEWVGLVASDWPASRRANLWSLSASLLGMGIASTTLLKRNPELPEGLLGFWLWFRDRWGVVWALRVRERFNRASEGAGWPVRLTWHGSSPASHDLSDAESLLASLIRRFANAERIAEARGQKRG